MTDEAYVAAVTLELYWAAFHQGTVYQRSEVPMGESAIAARKRVITKARKKLVKRMAAKP